MRVGELDLEAAHTEKQQLGLHDGIPGVPILVGQRQRLQAAVQHRVHDVDHVSELDRERSCVSCRSSLSLARLTDSLLCCESVVVGSKTGAPLTVATACNDGVAAGWAGADEGDGTGTDEQQV